MLPSNILKNLHSQSKSYSLEALKSLAPQYLKVKCLIHMNLSVHNFPMRPFTKCSKDRQEDITEKGFRVIIRLVMKLNLNMFIFLAVSYGVYEACPVY